MNLTRRISQSLLVLAVLVLTALPVSARIVKSRPSAAYTPFGVTPSIWSPLYSFVIGSGVEFQQDREKTEWGLPILVEYNFTERFKLTLEPKFARIIARSPDVRSVSGLGDFETSMAYEFLRERRYRPAFSVEGGVRWPTASDPDLGERGRDYSIGLIASKDLVFVDVDLNVRYTAVGDRARNNTVEASLAVEWHVSRYVDLIGEVANVSRLGSLRGDGTGDRHETEATVGFAWHVTKTLKFEQGVVFKEHGQREFVVAWEWSPGGD